ncbi:GNAT family N-acetyltransferase [Leifsonia sp. NPDC077715]|uniref:GNAT family N-acetyltransferase n=1 Tax=Leifsonia sp. NPDC077715 TaxID=3155539 RepID=UPI00341734DE
MAKEQSNATRADEASYPDDDELENPVWASLNGPHSRFAAVLGAAAAYDAEVAPFAALAHPGDPSAWDDLEALSAGRPVALVGVSTSAVPEGWRIETDFDVLQMTHDGVTWGELHDDGVRALGADDVRDMLRLVERARPGPFLPRTIELGRYVGVRLPADEGGLVAMAGERFDTGHWREVSAVSVDPLHRGDGLGTRVTRAVLDGMRSSGHRPFLHVTVANPAVTLYRRLGFRVRRRMSIVVVHAGDPHASIEQ